MKFTSYLLIFILLLIPFQSASAKAPAANQLVLTARQVDGAEDIEAAINSVTAKGTRSGTVILDGKDGTFVFSSPDKSLNIFVSSLTLRGENRASITGCDDGLYFEGALIQHVLVENITFTCTGDGVEAAGVFKDVTLRNNTFKVGLNGITSSPAYVTPGSTTTGTSTTVAPVSPTGPVTTVGSTTGISPSTGTSTVGGGVSPVGSTTVGVPVTSVGAPPIGVPAKRDSSSGWIIVENVISARYDGIRISGVQKFEISKNEITSNKGVVVLNSTDSLVKQNEIQASQIGILLGQEATKNTIQANKITGVNQAGIALEPKVTNNKIVANKITCAQGKRCLVIDPPSVSGMSNTLIWNGRS